ncbi:unnamed protein product [Ectocarpus sp. CCAP 1310/34]|nr:unnamed protein product [Ectocarpus sp. CCAP 1310/34]
MKHINFTFARSSWTMALSRPGDPSVVVEWYVYMGKILWERVDAHTRCSSS